MATEQIMKHIIFVDITIIISHMIRIQQLRTKLTRTPTRPHMTTNSTLPPVMSFCALVHWYKNKENMLNYDAEPTGGPRFL